MHTQNTLFCTSHSLACFHLKEDGEEVLIQLRNLGRKKSYLSEFCAVVMGDLVSQWPHKLVKELALSQIVPEGERKGGWEVCMPDMLYVLLMMEREHENVSIAKVV